MKTTVKKINRFRKFVFNFANESKLPETTCQYRIAIIYTILLFPVLYINYLWYKFGKWIFNKIDPENNNKFLSWIIKPVHPYSINGGAGLQIFGFIMVAVTSVFIFGDYIKSYLIISAIIGYIFTTPIAYIELHILGIIIFFMVAPIVYGATWINKKLEKNAEEKNICKKIDWEE